MTLSLFVAAACSVIPCAVLCAQSPDGPVDASRVLVRGASDGYTPRSGAVVYAVGTPAQTGGVYAGSGPIVYDDVTFATASGPVVLRSIEIGLIVPTASPQPPEPAYLRVTFFPNHDPSVPSAATPYSGTPVVWVIGQNPGCNVTPGGVCTQVVYSGPPLTLDDTNVFTSAGDRTCGVLIEPFEDRSLTLRSTQWQVVRRAGFASFLVGSSDTYGWFSTVSTGVVHNSDRSGGGVLGGAGNVRATFMIMYAALPCDADFNADGDTGTDADIEAFFACLAGNCCPSCASADFNADGDTGTDADIEAFFRALAGNPC